MKFASASAAPLRAEPHRATVSVGPFQVHDLSRHELVRTVVELTRDHGQNRVVTAFALHVGGLNDRQDGQFVQAMRNADIVYADGGSVVQLSRLAGAQRVERAPTTDVGWEVLRQLAPALGRPLRLALVGGPPGLASRAADTLREAGVGVPVQVEHGYHDHWGTVLQRVRTAEPDVCVIGMGAPREMLWVERWRESLPPSLVLTCGGWFGHIVGDERRAPRAIRQSGIEWVARLIQDPRRLAPRYAKGVLTTSSLAGATLARRLHTSPTRRSR